MDKDGISRCWLLFRYVVDNQSVVVGWWSVSLELLPSPSIFRSPEQISLWDLILEDLLRRTPLCPCRVLHGVPELRVSAPYWTAAGSLTPWSWRKKEQIRRLYFWFIEVIIYFFNCTFTCVLGRCVSTPNV